MIIFRANDIIRLFIYIFGKPYIIISLLLILLYLVINSFVSKYVCVTYVAAGNRVKYGRRDF